MSSFTFDLPDKLIAQKPAHPRDHARLLVYNRQTGEIFDDHFYAIDSYLQKDTTLVLNNTRVESCRWLFNQGKTEIFVLEKLDNRRIVAMVRPGRIFKLGKTVQLNADITATVQAINEFGHRTLELNIDHDDTRLQAHEHIPLPPYIEQDDTLANEYQTVYAKRPGSKAAPTAGLHFTKKLLTDIKKHHSLAEVELQVGLGTFAPLTEENFLTQTLHAENYYVSSNDASIIAAATHITAVGTTSLRTLESLPAARQKLTGSYSGETNIFITPGYTFKNVDSLITNFHLPSTSLLLLVEAFIGNRSELERIYMHAIKESYRFYSFGDAMLIL